MKKIDDRVVKIGLLVNFRVIQINAELNFSLQITNIFRSVMNQLNVY